MNPPTLPLDIYVRVSRVGGRDERLISPDEQEQRARALAAERALKVGTVLTDLDESGGKLSRPGLDEALERVERRESGGLIVAWLDRLSRDSEHAHALVRRITEAGGVIYAPDAPSDWTTPEGELQTGIIFAFAQYVRSRARAGFERSKEQAIARGIPVATRPAVGYRQRKDRRLELDPATAPIVRQVFEMRAAGAGPRELGRFLEDRQVPTSLGSTTWSPAAIYSMLRNRTYLGELSYGKPARFVNPDSHEPIVDLPLWLAAQNPSPKRPVTGERRAYLLSGLIRCATCGYGLQGTTSGRNRTHIYRCTRVHAHGGVCPAPARVTVERADTAAVEAFWSLVSDLQATGTPAVDPGLDGFQLALDAAQRALSQYMAPEVQEAIGDPALWAQGLRERREARDRAAEILGHARQQSPVADAPDVATLRDTWETATTSERRELLAARFDTFALYRDPVELVAYPTGTAPAGLPRQGNRRPPVPQPFPERPANAPEPVAA
jgi:DNA invertase Pin-like site-specific DNA recombinase